MTIGSRNFFAIVILATAFILSGNMNAAAQPEGGAAIMAIPERPSSGGGRVTPGMAEGQGRTASPKTSSALPGRAATTPTPRTMRTTTPSVTSANAKYNGPVIGDKYSFLNFEIAEKVQPIWTLKAQNAGALGLVQVEVLIDPNGNVLSAHARTGNPMLHPEAERAALATKFNKPTVNGRPTRAMGFIVYRFGTEEQEYEQERKNRERNQTDNVEALEGPVGGGVLNSRATSLLKPVYLPQQNQGEQRAR